MLQNEANGNFTGPVRDDVPKSTISGNTISEKLHDVYNKSGLFYLHILKVVEYQDQLLENNLTKEKIKDEISRIKLRLKQLSVLIENILNITNPGPTPAPLQLPHTDDYTKKEYGWGVIVRMKDWLTQVLQVLVSDKVCV